MKSQDSVLPAVTPPKLAKTPAQVLTRGHLEKTFDAGASTDAMMAWVERSRDRIEALFASECPAHCKLRTMWHTEIVESDRCRFVGDELVESSTRTLHFNFVLECVPES